MPDRTCSPPFIIDGAIRVEAKRDMILGTLLTLYGNIWRFAAVT